ncbi:leucine-rich repeat transmembrane neuronal protein 2-like, partial [Anneissia japonica]|uniref:leucine-rich repeat transmembrane neuronal protein 2-like n=1 Tax=Anneissia japonica TaxID=1529436 RepID=UPI0014255289
CNMDMLICIRILLLGLLSTLHPVSSVDCRTDRCHTHDGVTDCSSQKLSCIPCNIATATVLKMAHNVIRGLNQGDFHCFKNLKSIDLSHNQITNITDMTFMNMTEQSKTSLRYLNLQHNKLGLGLSVIQGKPFEGLSNLETLDLSFNQICTIANIFDGLSNLITLNLGNNEITELPHDMFKGLSNLQTLELQHNKIQTLGANAFGNTSHLKRLRIDHNDLTALHMQPFNNLKKLQHLDLGYNNLKTIGNNSFSTCSKLEYLKLNDNMLTSITKDLFGDHTLFKELQSF